MWENLSRERNARSSVWANYKNISKIYTKKGWNLDWRKREVRSIWVRWKHKAKWEHKTKWEVELENKHEKI